DEWDISLRTIYLVFGVLAIVASSTVIAVINTKRRLRSRMVLITFLAFADALNGLAFIVTAIGRHELIMKNKYRVPTTPRMCMLTKPWPVFLIIANELPALINLMLALESIVAMKYFSMYMAKWNYRHKIALGLFACLCCAVGF
ncbi:hypothetical protein Tcan_00426, partial [Toxocara canis]